MLESFAWIVCKVLWLQWTKHERSVSFFLYSFLRKQTLQGYRQCKLSSLLYFVVSLSAGLSDSQVPFHGTLSRHGKTRASSVLRMTYRKRCYTLYLLFKLFSLCQQEDSAATGSFSRKCCPQKLFFVVSLSAGLSDSQVVTCCTCCFSCFPYISKKTQQEAAA